MIDSSEHTVAHVERERAGERMRIQSSESPTSARQPLMRKSRGTGSDAAPIITIDGKIASEAELMAIDQQDIASIAVYKGKQGRLLLRSNDTDQLEATSSPDSSVSAKDFETLVAVTTKTARQARSKTP